MTSAPSVVVLAGGTGNLGGRIAKALVVRGAEVRALIRPKTASDRARALSDLGARIMEVDFYDPVALRGALTGAACVVSALSGLRPVIVDAQSGGAPLRASCDLVAGHARRLSSITRTANRPAIDQTPAGRPGYDSDSEAA